MAHRKFGVIQPWGRDLRWQFTVVSEHESVGAAFAKIDSMGAAMERNGVPSDAVQLLVIDEHGQIVPRPNVH